MKRFKGLVIILIVVVVSIGAFIGVRELTYGRTLDTNEMSVSVFDDDPNCYYLSEASENIRFQVGAESVDILQEFTITDSAHNPVSSELMKERNNMFFITPPKDGYVKGERYTLTIPDGMYFTDESLSGARKLIFCIERAPVENYRFTDAVVEVNQPVTEIDANTIRLDDMEAQPGKILFGQNADNSYFAYKIETVLGDGTAAVSVPALDEIYAELDIYGEYQFNVNNLATNPDLEIEIMQNVHQSSFFSALLVTAYADETPKDATIDVTVTPDTDNNTLEIEISITLEPGKNGLFGLEELKNHKVSLTLSSTLGLTGKGDFQGFGNWDVSASVSSDFEWQVEISYHQEPWDKERALDELFKPKDENSDSENNTYQKYIKKITEALDKMAADATTGELKLFDWNVPIPQIPGLTFKAEIKLFLNLEVLAAVTIEQESTVIYTVGVCLIDSEFQPYSNTYHSQKDIAFSLKGEAELQTGIKLEIAAEFVNEHVAYIKISPKIGFYAEAFIVVPVVGNHDVDLESFCYGHFEPGIVLGADLKSFVYLLAKNLEFTSQLIEKKIPFEFMTFGNDKIITGIVPNVTTVQVVNGQVGIPDIVLEYYDIPNGVFCTQKLDRKDYENVTFTTDDGVGLTLQNMKLTLPDTATSGGCRITATYLHDDGQTYSTTFHAILSGGILAGRVSAYTKDLSASSLEGATVSLYSSENHAAPISVQATNSDGNFTFCVDEGSYWIVISADGYHPLTSYQEVGERETTYTEHLLLIDDIQSGDGIAGGTITNAMDGHIIDGVKIKLRNDWNNRSGEYVESFETFTDSRGEYVISNVPVGHYTVEASIDGFVTGYFNVIAADGNYRFDYDFAITPELVAGEVRIVLNWDSTPEDLDAHLMGYMQYGDFFDVCYERPFQITGDECEITLDTDDATGYGPETITTSGYRHGTYTYVVHDSTNRFYDESSALSFSNAVVRVYSGNRCVAEYHVPTNQTGNYWTVFHIEEDGNILPVNTISNSNPAGDEKPYPESDDFSEKTQYRVYVNHSLVVVDDSAYVLPGTSFTTVFNAARTVAETTGYTIMIVLTDDLQGMSASEFSRTYYDDALLANQDGIAFNEAGYLLLVDTLNADFFLGVCHGAPADTISEMIFSSYESIGTFIESGNYEVAALNFLSSVIN